MCLDDILVEETQNQYYSFVIKWKKRDSTLVTSIL